MGVFLFLEISENSKGVFYFISQWDTSLGDGSPTIHLPLQSTGTYNFTVLWGDGTNSTITSWNQPEVSHTYAVGGVYTVELIGEVDGFNFRFGDDRSKDKIINVEQWGNIKFGNDGSYFYQAFNLDSNATDSPDLSDTTNLDGTFGSGFAGPMSITGGVAGWNTTGVTIMNGMFLQAVDFNDNLSGWDVSSVEVMFSMFRFASSFNGDVTTWNTSSLTNLFEVFAEATSFNQNLSGWDTSNVGNFDGTFRGATSFNGDITTWEVGGFMRGMLDGASSFNQDISGWDTSGVFNMDNMFRGTTIFNQDLSCWNVTNIVSEPPGFATGSALDISNRPIWGTDGSSC